MSVFDFLRWCLSDFWRFAGLAVLLVIVGQTIAYTAYAFASALTERGRTK